MFRARARFPRTPCGRGWRREGRSCCWTRARTPCTGPAPGFTVEEERSLIENKHGGLGDRIPVLPAAVAKLNAMVRDPECDVNRLADVIQTDEGLVARILKYANSAFYGLPGRIGTIQLAVTILGLLALRNLVVVAALAELARKLSDDPREAQWLWDHGIDVGVWCRSIARRTEGVDPEEAFTAGLIHDIGKNLILRELPVDRRKVKDWLVKEDEARSFEKDCVGFDHAQVGGWAAGRWKFPESLVQAVRWHHEPTSSPNADPELEKLIWIVHVADIFARADSSDPAVLQDVLDFQLYICAPIAFAEEPFSYLFNTFFLFLLLFLFLFYCVKFIYRIYKSAYIVSFLLDPH